MVEWQMISAWFQELPLVQSCRKDDWLFGGLEHCLFSHILGIIIPIDSYFSEGRSNHQPVDQDYGFIGWQTPNPSSLSEESPQEMPERNPGRYGEHILELHRHREKWGCWGMRSPWWSVSQHFLERGTENPARQDWGCHLYFYVTFQCI